MGSKPAIGKTIGGLASWTPRLLPENWELFQTWIFVLLMRLDSILHLSLLFLSLRPSDCWLWVLCHWASFTERNVVLDEGIRVLPVPVKRTPN